MACRKKDFQSWACDAVLAQLPDDLKVVFAVAYVTGWRVKSEILTRQRAHVDSPTTRRRPWRSARDGAGRCALSR